MKIENSNSIIKIRFDGFLSCIYIKKPRIIDWPDYGGSVARYYASLPINEWDKEIQKEIEKRVSSISSIEELKESSFLELLEPGEYEFDLWQNKQTSLLFNTTLLNSNENIHIWEKRKLGQSRADMQYASNTFYPFGRQLMFTQPFETLDPKQVKYYEKLIREGQRPIAIALRVKRAIQDDEESYQEEYYNTTKYVLDGHHKLVAYKNLNINPSYIVINRLSNEYKDDFDDSSLPNLQPYLFHFQIENIITNGINRMKQSQRLGEYIDSFLRNNPRTKDTFVSKLQRATNDKEIPESNRLWFKDRLETLKITINSKSKYHLEYWCTKDYRNKFKMVENWDDVKKTIDEQL